MCRIFLVQISFWWVCEEGIATASCVSKHLWEKKKIYTTASGSHAGAWSTHAGACVSVAAHLQDTLVRAFWRCCMKNVAVFVGGAFRKLKHKQDPTLGRGRRTLGRARG